MSAARLHSALIDVGYPLQQLSKLLQSVRRGLEASPCSRASSQGSQGSAGMCFSLPAACEIRHGGLSSAFRGFQQRSGLDVRAGRPVFPSGIPERAAGFRCGTRRDLPGCEAEACFSSLSQALSAAGAAAVNNNPVLDLQAAQPTASDCFLSLEVKALPHMNPIRRLMKRCTRCPKVGRRVACFHMILIFKVRVGH